MIWVKGVNVVFIYEGGITARSGGVPMANYGELWRIMAKVFMANWAKLNCAIRHNSPNFLQIYYRLGIFLLYRQAFLASIQVFNLCANAISR